MKEKFSKDPDPVELQSIIEQAEEEDRLEKEEEDMIFKSLGIEENEDELTMDQRPKKIKLKSDFYTRHDYQKPEYVADFQTFTTPLGRKLIRPKPGYKVQFDVKEKMNGNETDESRRSSKTSL